LDCKPQFPETLPRDHPTMAAPSPRPPLLRRLLLPVLLPLVFPGAAAAARIDPDHAVNLTLYHVHPGNYTGINDMNTADAPGDAFFDLIGIMLPILCANESSSHQGGFCYNPEERAHDLVVTRVLVEADDRFGRYGKCNICINGTVPMTKPPQKCVDGTYHCTCGGYNEPTRECEGPVGNENIKTTFGRWEPKPDDSVYRWFMYNLVNRVGGEWYSTTSLGEGSYWRLVEEQKRINATCQKINLDKSLYKLDPSCFDACPQPYNRTSPCNVQCVFKSMLGQDSGSKPATGGMTGEDITNLWVDSFEACPDFYQ